MHCDLVALSVLLFPLDGMHNLSTELMLDIKKEVLQFNRIIALDNKS